MVYGLSDMTDNDERIDPDEKRSETRSDDEKGPPPFDEMFTPVDKQTDNHGEGTDSDIDELASESWEETNRKRGILTKGDREYLLGQRELSGQDERNTRYRIRQRVAQGLLDIQLLADYFPLSDIKQIVEKNEDISSTPVSKNLIQFAYKLLIADPGIRDPKTWLEDLIERVIHSTMEPSDKPEAITISVEIEINRKNLEPLLEQADKESFTIHELKQLSSTVNEDVFFDITNTEWEFVEGTLQKVEDDKERR